MEQEELIPTLKVDGSVICYHDDKPIQTFHWPSVDVLFENASKVYINKLSAIIITGMGTNNAEGAGIINKPCLREDINNKQLTRQNGK